MTHTLIRFNGYHCDVVFKVHCIAHFPQSLFQLQYFVCMIISKLVSCFRLLISVLICAIYLMCSNAATLSVFVMQICLTRAYVSPRSHVEGPLPKDHHDRNADGSPVVHLRLCEGLLPPTPSPAPTDARESETEARGGREGRVMSSPLEESVT